jgi:hypothetical protein
LDSLNNFIPSRFLIMYIITHSRVEGKKKSDHQTLRNMTNQTLRNILFLSLSNLIAVRTQQVWLKWPNVCIHLSDGAVTRGIAFPLIIIDAFLYYNVNVENRPQQSQLQLQATCSLRLMFRILLENFADQPTRCFSSWTSVFSQPSQTLFAYTHTCAGRQVCVSFSISMPGPTILQLLNLHWYIHAPTIV